MSVKEKKHDFLKYYWIVNSTYKPLIYESVAIFKGVKFDIFFEFIYWCKPEAVNICI